MHPSVLHTHQHEEALKRLNHGRGNTRIILTVLLLIIMVVLAMLVSQSVANRST